MSRMGAIAFIGAGGHHHEFDLYPLTAHFKPGHGGVYFVTCRTDDEHGHHTHHKIFIGETPDLSTLLDNHPKQALFEAEGANCIAIHASQDAKARTRIVAELIEKYNPPGNTDEP